MGRTEEGEEEVKEDLRVCGIIWRDAKTTAAYFFSGGRQLSADLSKKREK